MRLLQAVSALPFKSSPMKQKSNNLCDLEAKNIPIKN